MGVGSIIHGNKAAVKKYLKYFIILYTLICTEKLTCFFWGNPLKSFSIFSILVG